jgi:subfamily B ATP-binding cassette protein MsbA
VADLSFITSNTISPLRVVGKHLGFYKRTRLLRRRECFIVMCLSTLTIVAEAGGIAMILPILSFVEEGRNAEQFAASSFLTQAIVNAYEFVGLEVTLLSLSVVSFAFIVLRQVVNYFNNLETERIRWTIGKRLTVRFFESVLGNTAEYIRTLKPGEFTITADNECQSTAAIAGVYAALWMHSVSFVAYGSILFLTAPYASILALLILVIAMMCLGILFRTMKRLGEEGVDFRRLKVDFLNERFRAWKLIKLGNTLAYEKRQYAAVADLVATNRIKLTKVSGLMLLIFIPVMAAFILFTLHIFLEVLNLNVATVILFMLVLLRLMPVSQSYQKQMGLLAQYDPSLDLINAALKRGDAEAERLDEGQVITEVKDRIAFKAVSFTYPDRDHAALNDITVDILAGRMTAIVGPSGAGKSTFVDLIPRLILPNRGVIEIDGTPAHNLALRSLRQLVTYIPQEPFLFDATFAENIRYLRPDATDQEVTEAAKAANADEFISELPLGYETRLGDGGANLSGGQKQRIVLARAFLSQASIFVLDEPTSALDYESESAIQLAVENLVSTRGCTVIVIAHRLSTIQNADIVIHLQAGKILKSGVASEVLNSTENPDMLFVNAQNPETAQSE